MPLLDLTSVLNLSSQTLTHRSSYQPEGARGIVVKIRRGYILEDGLALLNNLGEKIKSRLVIVYISITGHQEAGIGAGACSLGSSLQDCDPNVCGTCLSSAWLPGQIWEGCLRTSGR